MLIRGMWDVMPEESKATTYTTDIVQIIFFLDKINIMQYLYLLTVSFSIFLACHNMHVRVVKINLGIIKNY